MWRLRTRQLPRERAWCRVMLAGNKEIIYFGAGPFFRVGPFSLFFLSLWSKVGPFSWGTILQNIMQQLITMQPSTNS